MKSVTYDELTHLPAGLAAVASGELRLNPQHPPLVKLLAGLAASLGGPNLPLAGDAYRDGREWDFGREVLFEADNDHMRLLRAGRLPVVAISVLAGWLVFTWSRRRFGDAGGFLSLALYAFAPTVLAHARFVTMDVPLACFMLTCLYFLWRYTRRGSRVDLDRRSAARAPGGRLRAEERQEKGKLGPIPRGRSRLDRGIGVRRSDLKYPGTAADTTSRSRSQRRRWRLPFRTGWR